MKTIRLVNSNAKALVDDEDYEKLKQSEWRVDGVNPFYAFTTTTVDGRAENMTHAILGAPPDGCVWDHKDGNGLNNQRCNIRAATNSQNAQNKCKQRQSSSRFKGVVKCYRRWLAEIVANGKKYSLGRFATEEEAAKAYDDAARLHHGEFACVNFPRVGERCCLAAGDTLSNAK